jgi:hypothetical protein
MATTSGGTAKKTRGTKATGAKAKVSGAARPADLSELVRTQTVRLLDRSMSPRQAKAALRKTISGIPDAHFNFIRGIHILLLM